MKYLSKQSCFFFSVVKQNTLIIRALGFNFCLRGDWLKEAGFAVGRKVVIEDTKGQITIKLVDSEEA